jgi:branched-chain amino acid aminotransferase
MKRLTRSTHDVLPDPRNDQVLVYINGRLKPRAEAVVSVFDSAFLVGDGIWEGIRLHRGTFLFLDRHLDRLFQGMKAVGLPPPMTRAQFRAEMEQLVEANGMVTDVHIRLMVTRGIKRTPSQDPRLVCSGPTVVMIGEHKLPDPALKENGIALFTSTVRRGSPDALDPRLNCHSKLHEVTALIQALEAGADEALMLDIRGFVSTCNSTNFFVVRRGQVWTSRGGYCMNGITRAVVLEICGEAGIPAFERDFSLTDVYDADEAFVTGTFGGLTPVVKIDGRVIGEGAPGETWKSLQAQYEARVDREASVTGEAGP